MWLIRIIKRFVRGGIALSGKKITQEKAVISLMLAIIKRIAREDKPRDEKELKVLYRSLFSDAAGEVVLEDLCRRFYIASSTIGLDNREQVREGERNAVLYILTMACTPVEPPAEGTA